MELGSLIRATNLWGYTDLMRELGADPLPFLRRFDIPPGIEHQEDAFMSLAGFVRMLEASAAELDCPDFGLRLARWQGLGILGPVAVIARNAAALFGGLEAIGRYLYVHSPALTLTVSSTTARSNVRFGYEVTEPGIPYPLQGYELSMANAARMIRLLGGPQARARVFSFRHAQLGTDAAYREALGCTVRFGRTWCGFEVDHRLAGRPIDHADPETKRHRHEIFGIPIPSERCHALRAGRRVGPPPAADRPMQRRGHRRPTRHAPTNAAAALGCRGPPVP